MAAKMYQLPYAGFVSRFIAFVIDLVIINLISLIIAASIGVILDFFGLDNSFGDTRLFFQLLQSTIEKFALLIAISFTTAIGIIYFLFFWVLVGITPGKAMLGLRIVGVNGQRLRIGQAILRLAGYWISTLLLFLGFFIIIFDNRRQGLHDKLARTVVIYNWKSQDNQ